ncbi:hypothetical protein DPMN_048614 [Dreissena polymorpha]|uniref:Uncharacterized protein n=1 Tax=Dreissena polymorpha TaxID=45954 RepID=A0A9D4DBZ5_DREPO|nr:hypothetical protein DPMN_048614 [Dreissena polymorpha]
MMPSMTMRGWLMRLMLQLFWHRLKLPLFGIVMTCDWGHSMGYFFYSLFFCKRCIFSLLNQMTKAIEKYIKEKCNQMTKAIE